MKARPSVQQPPALATEPTPLVAGAAKRAGASALNKITRIIIPNPE
jgi:hypothetical protein